jgi:hypothetical protein
LRGSDVPKLRLKGRRNEPLRNNIWAWSPGHLTAYTSHCETLYAASLRPCLMPCHACYSHSASGQKAQCSCQGPLLPNPSARSVPDFPHPSLGLASKCPLPPLVITASVTGPLTDTQLHVTAHGVHCDMQRNLPSLPLQHPPSYDPVHTHASISN